MHVELQCLLPWWPLEYPHTTQCDIFNKVRKRWLDCLAQTSWSRRWSESSHSPGKLRQFTSTSSQRSALSKILHEWKGSTIYRPRIMCVCKKRLHVFVALRACRYVCANVDIYHSMTHKPHQRLSCKKLRRRSFKEEGSSDKTERAKGATHTHTHPLTHTLVQDFEQGLEIPFGSHEWSDSKVYKMGKSFFKLIHLYSNIFICI